MDDREALDILKKNFIELKNGFLVKKNKKYQPTEEEFKAIDFLCDEWDFLFDPEYEI